MAVAVFSACLGSLISSIYLAAETLLSTDMDPVRLFGWFRVNFRHCHCHVFSNSIFTKSSTQHALIALWLKWMWMKGLLLRGQICAKFLLVNVFLGLGGGGVTPFKWSWSPNEAVMGQQRTIPIPFKEPLWEPFLPGIWTSCMKQAASFQFLGNGGNINLISEFKRCKQRIYEEIVFVGSFATGMGRWSAGAGELVKLKDHKDTDLFSTFPCWSKCATAWVRFASANVFKRCEIKVKKGFAVVSLWQTFLKCKVWRSIFIVFKVCFKVHLHHVTGRNLCCCI